MRKQSAILIILVLAAALAVALVAIRLCGEESSHDQNTVFIAKRAAGYAAIFAGSLPGGQALVDPKWLEVASEGRKNVGPFPLFSSPAARLERPMVEYSSAVLQSGSMEAAALLGCPQGMWRLELEVSERTLLVNTFADDPKRWLGDPGSMEIPESDRVLISTGLLLFGDLGRLGRVKALGPVFSRLDQPLYHIGRVEITNGQYATFLNSLKDKGAIAGYYNLLHPSAKIVERDGAFSPLSGCEDYPVTAVTWSGARAFCRALGAELPSGIEWELAARGGEGSLYPWGEEFDPARANLYGDADGFAWLAPVDSMPQGAGPFGALHQAGNAFEWIDRPEGKPGTPRDSAGLRGGAWNTMPDSARSARADTNLVSAANEHNGFRCCWPMQTPWGQRLLMAEPPPEPGPPPKRPPREIVRMGAGITQLKRAVGYVDLWAALLRGGPSLVHPDWYPEIVGKIPHVWPFALFTQRDVRLDQPVIRYASALLPRSSSEAAALLGCPRGLWTVAMEYDGRALLINHYKEDPERWIGGPGTLAVPDELKVMVPAGTYLLGEGGRPARRVSLPGFMIGRYEVTNAQLAAVLNQVEGSEVHRLVDLNHPAIKVVRRGGGYAPLAGCEDFPATCMTWYGAERICRSLGGRLPTSDEWEAAARGPDSWLYPWGNQWDAARANVWGVEDGFEWLAPADSFHNGAGRFGTLNQSGNAYEWVDNRGRPRNPGDPVDMGELRGGSWMTLPDTARADIIDGNYLYVANDHNGVRCVWPLTKHDSLE